MGICIQAAICVALIGVPLQDPSPVAHCRQLGYLEKVHYIHSLGAKGDLDSLRQIYESDVGGAHYAIAVAADHMSAQEVLALCYLFKVGSDKWTTAFIALESKPKQAVISYFRLAAKSPDPCVRALCYDLCARAGWDDVAADATKDLNNDTHLDHLNALPCETVGFVAKHYLETIKRQTAGLVRPGMKYEQVHQLLGRASMIQCEGDHELHVYRDRGLEISYIHGVVTYATVIEAK